MRNVPAYAAQGLAARPSGDGAGVLGGQRTRNNGKFAVKEETRIRRAMRQHKVMTDSQLLEFEKAVLEIAAHERGNRKKAQDLLKICIVPEKIRRGL